MSVPLARLTDESDGVSGTAPRPLIRGPLGPACAPSPHQPALLAKHCGRVAEGAARESDGTTGSKVWILATDFGDQDMYHWVYIDNAGTYSVFWSASLEVAAFRRSDLTHELAPTDVLSMSALPPAVRNPAARRQRETSLRRFEDQGSIYACREPFFLRIRGTSPSFTGRAPFRRRTASWRVILDRFRASTPPQP